MSPRSIDFVPARKHRRDTDAGYQHEDTAELLRASKNLGRHLEHLAECRRLSVEFAGGDPESDAALQRLYAAVEHQYQVTREFRRLWEVYPDLDRWGELIEGAP
jgi:hypothetical protein